MKSKIDTEKYSLLSIDTIGQTQYKKNKDSTHSINGLNVV